ncbi:hypothetical protein P153DRAFT_384400 [Dothidotthia symphoricarpi CBS 119687]|uniref:Uncharacterized protein n=1 Tax=Dothidotthia symphoricarpi CBS 119687 TaxID=1392245 RepID=A0A6A6AL54_9PLEO|nr:uncharacterized protein P153DRAFT_384400 [Dothidotthia symphoricarpi CBS 119687]KAF2131181.1 hypothetical protein P153DRAFT_384400 [Dothidotthia symphoricarpi CBS 119687]
MEQTEAEGEARVAERRVSRNGADGAGRLGSYHGWCEDGKERTTAGRRGREEQQATRFRCKVEEKGSSGRSSAELRETQHRFSWRGRARRIVIVPVIDLGPRRLFHCCGHGDAVRRRYCEDASTTTALTLFTQRVSTQHTGSARFGAGLKLSIAGPVKLAPWRRASLEIRIIAFPRPAEDLSGSYHESWRRSLDPPSLDCTTHTTCGLACALPSRLQSLQLVLVPAFSAASTPTQQAPSSQ